MRSHGVAVTAVAALALASATAIALAPSATAEPATPTVTVLAEAPDLAEAVLAFLEQPDKLPETLGKGTQITSIMEVMGMANRIKWTIVNWKPPQSMTLNGEGKGGVKVKLMGKIRPSETDPSSSVVTFDVHLGGPALFGPIGMVVAGGLKGDIKESLEKFKSTFA